jgi:hypothetical protein
MALFSPEPILYLLEATNDFIEGNTSADSHEVQLDKVD